MILFGYFKALKQGQSFKYVNSLHSFYKGFLFKNRQYVSL